MPVFRRAIELDPEFALAYARLRRARETSAPSTAIATCSRKRARISDSRTSPRIGYDQARHQFDEVFQLPEGSITARNGLFTIATITGDAALADAQISAMKGRRDEVDFLSVQAQAAAYKAR